MPGRVRDLLDGQQLFHGPLVEPVRIVVVQLPEHQPVTEILQQRNPTRGFPQISGAVPAPASDGQWR